MKSGNGRFSMIIHDEEEKIFDNNDQICETYRATNRDVISDITLANQEQCLLKYRIGLKDVQHPVHLNNFVMSYSQRRMNRIVVECDGFRNWDNTFYYADTDSLFIHISLWKN